MDDKIFDKIEDVDLKKKMEDSYIDYAMSVIAARALPDVRDERSINGTVTVRMIFTHGITDDTGALSVRLIRVKNLDI